MVKDIILLGLDSRDDSTQESSTVITTVNTTVTADITVDAVITADESIINNSYTWCNDQYE